MAINMFGASVNTFVGAVDKTSDPKYQAAYLGQIGRDMGLQGLGIPTVPVGGHGSIGGYGVGSTSGGGQSVEPAKSMIPTLKNISLQKTKTLSGR